MNGKGEGIEINLTAALGSQMLFLPKALHGLICLGESRLFVYFIASSLDGANAILPGVYTA